MSPGHSPKSPGPSQDVKSMDVCEGTAPDRCEGQAGESRLWSHDFSNPAGAAGTAYLLGAFVKDPIVRKVGSAYKDGAHPSRNGSKEMANGKHKYTSPVHEPAEDESLIQEGASDHCTPKGVASCSEVPDSKLDSLNMATAEVMATDNDEKDIAQ